MSQRKGSVKEEVRCRFCDKGVGEKDSGIQCELCEKWYHAVCVKISEDVYKVLGKMSNLHWFCESCNNSAQKLFINVAKLNDKVSQLELDFKTSQAEYGRLNEQVEKFVNVIQRQKEDTDTEFRKVRSSIQDIDNSVQNLVEAKLQNEVERKVDSFRDIVAQQLRDEVKENVDVQIGNVSEELRSMQQTLSDTREAAAEEQDKENRKNNIILYRVDESDADTAEQRNEQDKRFCEQLLTGLEVGIADDDVRRLFRLGRRDAARGPRPILVQLASRGAKNMIMESLYKLKSMEAKFKNVIIAHDMTRRERDECKALVTEAKNKTQQEQGDWVYRVRGPPGQMTVVKLRKRY